MLDALSAEALKLGRHKATWGLVWIYPIAMLVILGIVVVVTLANGPDAVQNRPSLEQWLADASGFWQAPGSTVCRLLIAGYVAVLFAGEYGWNTWKLVVPHRRRPSLIAAKFALIVLLLAIAFTIAAWLFTAGRWADDSLGGDVIPEGVGLGGLIAAHGTGMLAALAPVLVTIGYAALAAILTRSTVGALIVSIVAVAVESLVAGFGPLLSIYLPGLMWGLFHILPGYHLANLTEWIRDGAALTTPFPDGSSVSLGWTISPAVLAAWVVGLWGATFAAFARQDIN